MFQAEKGANAIPGYTGFTQTQNFDADLLQIQGNRNHIPNYAGFVPGIKAENLFGKTFGKITLLSGTRQNHQGSNLPADLRYRSEVKEAYCDQNQQRNKDKLLYGKLDSETSKALAYSLSNLTSTQIPKTTKARVDTKERVSNMSYQEALKQAGK
ncbi:unnamed protein product [Paramecium primaurelia]|uniref:Uncharacterized protein n=2 Tax=Paramecium TaxID=5884 RepID=A0A8S1TWE1_9CILI|nr:unnamed protein product [Paramecium primaurelia]CAD8157165.1 unnamed protein product [Paramecium pentaurelia]